METWPLVSIITVNFNGSEITNQLLNSLSQISYKNIEIIVVDNASNTPPDVIKKKYPIINLIRSKKNIGFAKAVNCGLNIIKTKYVLLLNPDAYINFDSIIKLRETFDKYSNTIIAVPSVYNENTYSAEYGLLPEQSKGIKRNYFE